MTKIAAVREATNWTKNALDEFNHATSLNIIASRAKRKNTAVNSEEEDAEEDNNNNSSKIDESGNPFVNEIEKQIIRDELKGNLLKQSVVLFLNYFEEIQKRGAKLKSNGIEPFDELALECVKSVVVMNGFKSINEQLRLTPTGKSLKKLSFARASEELRKIISDVELRNGSGEVISKSDEVITTKRIAFLDSIVKNNGTSSFTPDEYSKAFEELLENVLKDSLKLWSVAVSGTQMTPEAFEELETPQKASVKKRP